MKKIRTTFEPVVYTDPMDVTWFVENLVGAASAPWRSNLNSSSIGARADSLAVFFLGIKEMILKYPEERDRFFAAIDNVVDKLYLYSGTHRKALELFRLSCELGWASEAHTVVTRALERGRILEEEDRKELASRGESPWADFAPMHAPEELAGDTERLLCDSSVETRALQLMGLVCGVKEVLEKHPDETAELVEAIDNLVDEIYLYTPTYQAAKELQQLVFTGHFDGGRRLLDTITEATKQFRAAKEEEDGSASSEVEDNDTDEGAGGE